MSKDKKRPNPNRTQAAVVGPPGLLALGSLSLLVTKPSAADLMTMQQWILRQPLPTQRGISADELDGLSAAQQRMLFDSYARNRATKRLPTEAEIVEITSAPKGVAMMVWLAARRHQTVSLAEIEGAINSENCLQVQIDLEEAVSAPGDEMEPDDPKVSDGPSSS